MTQKLKPLIKLLDEKLLIFRRKAFLPGKAGAYWVRNRMSGSQKSLVDMWFF